MPHTPDGRPGPSVPIVPAAPPATIGGDVSRAAGGVTRASSAADVAGAEGGRR